MRIGPFQNCFIILLYTSVRSGRTRIVQSSKDSFTRTGLRWKGWIRTTTATTTRGQRVRGVEKKLHRKFISFENDCFRYYVRCAPSSSTPRRYRWCAHPSHWKDLLSIYVLYNFSSLLWSLPRWTEAEGPFVEVEIKLFAAEHIVQPRAK